MKNPLRYRRAVRLIALIAAGAAAMAAARGARAQVLNGALITLVSPTFATGGLSTVTGGSIVLTHSIGLGSITPMGGGSLGISPGILGGVPTATPDFTFAHAFPTPYQPSLGHDRITFRGLPVRATIRIYTVTGQLVNTLVKNDPFSADYIWQPVANASGRSLASGVYYYQITGDNGRASGKLMVIR